MSGTPRSDPAAGSDASTGGPGWRDQGNQAILFNLLWAIGTLAHVLRKTRPNEHAVWLLIIAAVLVLDRPSSRLRLGMLATTYLVYFWTTMPWIGNHAHMMAFVNLGILAALAVDWVRRRGGACGGWPLPVRYIRLTVLLSYGAAALAKLNSGFFAVETSCAVGMAYKALAALGVAPGSLPAGVEAVLPYGIAGLELLIPVLLFVPGGRRTGIVVVVVFHFIMSFSPSATAIDFTLVLLALVFLFFPQPTASRVFADAGRLPGRLIRPLVAKRTALFIVAAFVLAVAQWSGKASLLDNRNWILLAVATLVLGPLFLHYAMKTPSFRFPLWRPGPERGTPLVVGIAFGLLVAIQLANCAAPYLGSKNLGTFTMYSNLRTEGGVSNHFLIPRWPGKARQDDLVEIIDSSSEWLCGIRDVGQLISWHELRRILVDYPDASLTYRRGGVETRLERARDNPELVRLDPVAHRFIGIRLYDPRNDTCRH
ncbi:MAG: hypothetical protein R3F07_07635 [Opitutaceae bacterium]